MRIMLTNDDGFFAPGITALYHVLSIDRQHEIAIVAPEGQRSAAGRSITIYKPLFVTNHDLPGNDTGLAVNGTPTDCVKLAVQGEILHYKPDLIISGINDGPNVGTDIFYSGTVAAAMEGVLLGIPSLAVSLASYEYQNYMPSAYFIKNLIERHPDFLNNRDGLLNINIPGIDKDCWKGVRFTKLGKSVYDNTFESRKAPFGKEYFWISGTPVYGDEEDTDLKAIQQGFVSITPLHGDLTDYNKMERLKDTDLS
ncbi:MAG: 5'-nucleotidase SurE [Candidatus Dichloromethanomonas elyunquensis]|nr:MAG: 5'-nucleotidase SurE [Candidatus Dichloromethanomonas elyunquensis]